MKVLSVLLASVVAVTPIARAAEPDHLVPVFPYPGDQEDARYSNELRSRFKLDSVFFAQMVVRPSFHSEYVVRLHGQKEDNHFTTANQFFLTYSIADKNIWYSMREDNDKKRKEKVKISTTTAEIPKALALRIQQLWEQMLLRTRYREQDVISSHEMERIIGTDGTIFEFAVWNAYGKTWSPDERLSPLLLVELGESLVGYCKAIPGERPAATNEIENKATQLEQYLNEHPFN
jgi:hypothetical protein